jgi:hypothetical protein
MCQAVLSIFNLLIVLYTVLSGFIVREVELLGESDSDENVDIDNIVEDDTTQAILKFVTSEKLNTAPKSRYDLPICSIICSADMIRLILTL